MKKRNIITVMLGLILLGIGSVLGFYTVQSAATRPVADALGVEPIGGGVEGKYNPRNAITHSYWQASWTFYAKQILGDTYAEVLMTYAGYLVDPPGINIDDDSIKDRWNNRAGRACGLKAVHHDEITDCLREAMQSGKLIMKVSDPRLKTAE